MATPTKRTPENRARVVALLSDGTTKTAAAAAVRMSRQTLSEWIAEDEGFALEIEEAVQSAITRNVLLLQRAAQDRTVKKTRTEFEPRKDKEGKETGRLVKTAQTVEEYVDQGDWRAAAWFLEKTDPENFGKRVDVTSAGARLPAATVLVGLDGLDDAELDRRIAQAQAGAATQALPEEP